MKDTLNSLAAAGFRTVPIGLLAITTDDLIRLLTLLVWLAGIALELLRASKKAKAPK